MENAIRCRAGSWVAGPDLNYLGGNAGGAPPTVSFGLFDLLGPVVFSKFYAPISLLILGTGAWTFFRQMGFSPPACILGALAAALNMTFFSDACWGVAAHAVTVGMTFFALAALVDTGSRARWLRVTLAGLAVGMAVSEGADIGAIFSLYVAAFVVYQPWVIGGPRLKNFALGAGRVLLVAFLAVFLAAHALFGFVTTSIEGIAGTQQDSDTRAARWNWATQWSLPKVETLSLAVPGLFGYRTDTPGGGQYWGIIGRNVRWERYFESGGQLPPPTGALMRYTGSGFYAGVPVLMVAAWALIQSFHRRDSVFNPAQCKWIWFWGCAGLISLLLAYGRFGFLYQVIYALPYFSTIRNPVKFLNPLSLALVILFVYGVDGLCRSTWERANKRPDGTTSPISSPISENIGSTAAGRSWPLAWGLGWIIMYGFSRQSLEQYLQGQFFDEAAAYDIAGLQHRPKPWAGLFFYSHWRAASPDLDGHQGLCGEPGEGGRHPAGPAHGGGSRPGESSLDRILGLSGQKYASGPDPRSVAGQTLRTSRGDLAISAAPVHADRYALQTTNGCSNKFPTTASKPWIPRAPRASHWILLPLSAPWLRPIRPRFPTCVARRWQLTNTRYLIGRGTVPQHHEPGHPGSSRLA